MTLFRVRLVKRICGSKGFSSLDSLAVERPPCFFDGSFLEPFFDITGSPPVLGTFDAAHGKNLATPHTLFYAVDSTGQSCSSIGRFPEPKRKSRS